MGKKYKSECLVNLTNTKDGKPDFENERIQVFNPNEKLGLVFKTRSELPTEILESYKSQIETLAIATGNSKFASKSEEIARDSAFCDFMGKLEAFLDYASNFIDLESVTTKELTDLDRCTDDE